MLRPPESTGSIRITDALHIQGWHHLDAVILAALATEAPVLLIGRHGTAKTLLVERLSGALGLNFRHYNASLLNYDDLVGIPIPEEDEDQLRFITTPGAIWDAEFVFFDEISRCRPDLQNKLFPIIHERRIVGMPLHQLRYRWAAMNPPSPDNIDFEASAGEYYLGSEPLDPALTDRFPFVIPVPNWHELSRDDQRRLLARRMRTSDNGTLESAKWSLHDLVKQCRERMPQVEDEVTDWLVDYLIAAMDLLAKAKLSQSTRRAQMLKQSIVAIHTARCVLEGDEVELTDSAEIALLYGIPQNATDVPPSPAALVAIHRQAWELTHMLDDEVWRTILEETDALKRVLIADDLGVEDEELSHLITQALSSLTAEPRRVSVATAMFLAFRETRHLTPAAWEPLAKLAGQVLLPRQRTATLAPNAPDVSLWNEIKPLILKQRGRSDLADLQMNYLLGGFPEMWRNHDWQDALKQFTQDLKFFGVTGG